MAYIHKDIIEHERIIHTLIRKMTKLSLANIFSILLFVSVMLMRSQVSTKARIMLCNELWLDYFNCNKENCQKECNEKHDPYAVGLCIEYPHCLCTYAC
ncbi:hypothetical protein PIB30_085372 [Stylosanthes scabra]|uniref:Defensin-like protein n=1 Tax=Stylosanthes scabra TaxID=79078 RepID=A0ABU6RT48_9FABA|nr:hypothetical protein [Stylosanthes scabra]